MAGLQPKYWHEAYKNCIILGNPLYTGMRSTLCSVCDGASVMLPFAVSADTFQMGNGNRFRFGGANVYLRNTGNASLALNAARIIASGRLVLKLGNPISAVSIIGSVSGATVRVTTRLVVKGQASCVSIIGTNLRAGNTLIKTTGITTASMSVSKMYIADDVKMASGKKIYTNGTTGVYSPSTTELHLQISGNGIIVVKSTSLAPKVNENVSLGTNTERYLNGYIKTLYSNGVNASTCDFKAGNFRGSLASVTNLKAHAGNVSLLTVASVNSGVVRGTKSVMSTASSGYLKGTNMALAGNASVTGDMVVEGDFVQMKNLPTASAGLDSGQLYLSSGTIKVKA